MANESHTHSEMSKHPREEAGEGQSVDSTASNESTDITDKKPLLTFALIAYNQERFIRDAVEGALAQTYSPLEVILSDDCSTDRTYAIMQEIVDAYDGPHRVLLNRNATNLGLVPHVNLVFELSSGELIILAAGDDISYPDRASVLFDAWRQRGRPAVVMSGFDSIDAAGHPIPDNRSPDARRAAGLTRFEEPGIGSASKYLDNELPSYLYLGATEAVSRRLIEMFGPLAGFLNGEDTALVFRSLLLEGHLYIPLALIKYRIHPLSVSEALLHRGLCSRTEIDDESKTADIYRFASLRYRSFADDVATAASAGILDEEDRRHLIAHCERRYLVANAIVQWWTKPVPWRIVTFFTVFVKYGTAHQKMWALKRMGPKGLFSTLLKMKALLRAPRYLPLRSTGQ